MMTDFLDLRKKDEIFKARLYLFSAFICSFIFYYFMTGISSEHIDFFPGRVVLASLGLCGFLITYIKPGNFRIIRFLIHTITIGYLCFYLYLLDVNNWSVFHRWSYFVVVAILCSSALTWSDFLFYTYVGLLAPLFFSFHTPLTLMELIHFHSANVVTILLIGYSVRSHFRYKQEASTLAQDLVEKSKMAVLGEMAAGVSHEVNNPLTVLTTSGEQLKRLAEKGQFDQKRFLDLIDKINRMTLRISKIVNGLKEFSSNTYEETSEQIDLKEIIVQILKHCEQKFQTAGVQVVTSLPEASVYSIGQKAQIAEALNKLLENAFDACRDEREPIVKVSLSIEDNFARIAISDNGPGVPDELMTKIMQPFFTTKELGTGPGLGLSIALGIAQRHNGRLYIDKKISSSCFALMLPLSLQE